MNFFITGCKPKKCELLKQVERELFWQKLDVFLMSWQLCLAERRHRKTAKELERRGIL